MKRKVLFWVTGSLITAVWGENVTWGKQPQEVLQLAEKSTALQEVRQRISKAEKDLLATQTAQKSAQSQLIQIKKLIQLLHEEKAQGEKRMSALEKAVGALEERKTFLQERMAIQGRSLRQFLIAVDTSSRSENAYGVQGMHLPEQEKWEAPRRKLLTNLVTFGVREIEVLKVDLADAAQLEEKIQLEKQELAYLFHDLKEQESILELNRQLQLDLIQKKKSEHWAHLKSYRRLKDSEVRVESVVGSLNAREELGRVVEREKKWDRTFGLDKFAHLKGRLTFPVEGGKVLSSFGRAFDSQTGLYLFKKGVDISVEKSQDVRSISSGIIAFAGELPNYGQVVIIDHGDHYYSLLGRLGSFSKKVQDRVAAGEFIGKSDNSGNPIYFEIRSRNVAVNPLQWLTN